MAHLPKRRLDGLDLHKEIADLFQEVVKMKRPDDIGKPGKFERSYVLAAGHFWNDVEHAQAGAFFRGDAGEFPKREK